MGAAGNPYFVAKVKIAHQVLASILHTVQSMLAFTNANALSFVDFSTGSVSSTVADCGSPHDWPLAEKDAKVRLPR